MYDDNEEEEDSKGKGRRKNKEQLVFTVWECDKNKDIARIPAFESFGNPIPAIRYAQRLNKKSGRHFYTISPRPNHSSYVAAGVKPEVTL